MISSVVNRYPMNLLGTSVLKEEKQGPSMRSSELCLRTFIHSASNVSYSDLGIFVLTVL